jgi:outer membrane protein assembly factor BamB
MFTVSVDGDTGSTRWTTRSSISNSLVTQYGSSVLLGAAGELYAIGSSARGQAKWVPVIEKYRARDGGLIWRFEHAVGDNSWYPCCARQTEDGSLLIAAQAKTDFGERVGLLKLLDRPPTHPDTLFADSFD